MRSAITAVIGTLVSFGVVSGLSVAGPGGSSIAFAKEEASQLTKVSVDRADDDISVIVRGSQPPNFTSFTLNKPFRVVLDWAGSQLAGVKLEREFDRGLIKRIRIRQFSSEAEQISRVIVELVQPTTYRVEADGNAVIMHFVPVAPPPPPPADPAEPDDPEPFDEPLDPEPLEDEPLDPEPLEDEPLDPEPLEDEPLAPAPGPGPSDPGLDNDGFEPLDDFGDPEDDVPAEEPPRTPQPAESAPPPAGGRDDGTVTPDITLDQVNESFELAESDDLPPLDDFDDDDPYEDIEEPPPAAQIPPPADPLPRVEPARTVPSRSERRAPQRSARSQTRTPSRAQGAGAASSAQSNGGELDRPDLGVDGRRAMREIGFRDGPQVDTVFVKTDKLTRYRQYFRGKTFVLELLNTGVPRRNDLNPLPTKYFDSPVLHVQARRRRRVTSVEIKLRDEVKWRIKRRGQEIAVYFERR